MTAPLNAPQQAMVKLAALTAYGDLVGLEMALHHGLDSGLTVNEIQEILVQLYAYCGFPRSLNALATLMAVVNARRQAGTRDPVGPTASPPPPDWDSLAAGRDNQTRLVGGPVTGGLFDFAPAIDQFLKSHLFGDIFQRDVVDWPTRELATVAALTAMSGVSNQLRSHFAISLHSGLTREQLQQIITMVSSVCDGRTAADARYILDTL